MSKLKSNVLEQLPTQIIESDELSLAAKKTLGALLLWTENSKALESGIIAVSNSKLCQIGGVGGTSLIDALAELKLYGLIDRRVGTGLGDASEYTIHFERLEEPLKKRSIGERFARFMNKSKSLEKPISATLHNITLHNIAKHNIAKHNIAEHNIAEHNIAEQAITEQSIAKLASSDLEESRGKGSDNNILYNNKLNNNNLLKEKDNNIIKENSIFDNNLLKEEKGSTATTSSTPTDEAASLLDCCVLDPSDFEEDDSFIQDLNKRLAYLRWDSEK